MIKTIQVDESVRKLITDKQKNIKEIKGINVQMRDIVEKLIKDNIEKLDL